ncbi:alpha/beta hydrolase [Mesoplasma florum]|uniref:alpha/beta hydrolase n=1 Tax=Mesoplasma florum TaxID=2151 RepID=UPI000BE429BE|nr:alpha/beta hydrolase [Mesoplasma florum]ATI73569.1 alpha/beta hydrolase [Mesoplasma florum]ATI74259.1 alpha/beta hydrolase [Mesoplasma florum]AVN61962.1 alpha/beta hydrolase [Mesoplasma florum]
MRFTLEKINKYKYSLKTVLITLLQMKSIKKNSSSHFLDYKNFCYNYYRDGFTKEGIKVNSLDIYYDDLKNKNLNYLSDTFSEKSIEEFDLFNSNGKISCLVAKNANSKKWVVGLHGWTENKFLALRLVHHFWKQGYNILTFDAFAHGLSYGEKTDIGYSSISMLETIVEHLKNEEQADSIGLIGNSMGASTSILFVQKNKLRSKINWVVADCGFSNIKLQYRYYIENNLYHVPWWKIGFLFTHKFSKETKTKQRKYNLLLNMKKAKSNPIFFVHSKGDTFIPYEMSQIMYEKKIKYEKVKISKIWTPEGSEHVNTIKNYNDDYILKTINFARKWEVNETK